MSRLRKLQDALRVALIAGALGVPYPAAAQGSAPPDINPGARTQLKPGWNMFSPEQDVELGQQAAREAEKQVPMLRDSRVDNYLNSLGRRLAARTPGPKFPYTFKAVNDRSINAFALPGGPVYIHRGVIEAANNEAQLAGVMAHEAAHVALRHGTNQASKASAAQVPLAILGGILGNNSTGAAIAQLGAGFTLNSILLKYSRSAETQADIMGTQIVADAGLDPRGMAQFFETLLAQDKGGRRIEFFEDHPSPDRRIESVNQEIARLGNPQRGNFGSGEFESIKRYVQGLPAPRNVPRQVQSGAGGNNSGQSFPDTTSDRMVAFENGLLRIDHPQNWQAYGQGDALTIAPRGGLVADANGNQALAYGVIVNIYEPHSDRYSARLQGPGYDQNSSIMVEEATDQLVEQLRQTNRNMRVLRTHENINVNGERGLSTYLSNDSPLQGAGRETNWLVTLPVPEGLLFFVFTAPERDFREFQNTFRQMMYSVRLKR